MADKIKMITEQQGLQAFALFTMAAQLYAQVREFERGISRTLGHDEEFVDHISDALYGEDGGSVQVFREKLKYAGYAIKPAAKKKRKAAQGR